MAAVFLLMPISALADAWSVFEARCLDRMAEVAPPDLNGMTLLGSVPGLDIWTAPSGMTVTTTAPGEDAALSCAVSWDRIIPDRQTSGDKAKAWTSEALRSDSWEDVTGTVSHSPITLRSTLWREPRMEVAVSVLEVEGHPRFVARETDLES
ncbi:hypothetical protein SAMN05444004_105207 [Jannaschia faecimaris]|uniref:Uncharacterized protein n=1 Tax=Jannaschia faecimaris TaxID=1244108 RepID=A0A1H3PXC4_9RHOB|nr:hypothetical protein [Jannaschia faecimaris]SDZ05640.1 hypothetical protein SAMN05444004_105207 [Jannaschia faecimaris]